MKTKFIEATHEDGNGNWGKFAVCEWTNEEWNRASKIPGTYSSSLLGCQGWDHRHYWVLDLATGEGACFRYRGHAKSDLDKHRVWVCPLFEPFLAWLYRQDFSSLDDLPDTVTFTHKEVEFRLSGYRRPGPEP